MDYSEEISRITQFLGHPQVEGILHFLKDSPNFAAYLKKITSKSDKEGITAEIRCAYMAKKFLGQKIAFLPDNMEDAEIIPGFKSKENYNVTKKPDIWVYGEKWYFWEAKRLRMYPGDFMAVFDKNFDHQKALARTTGRVIGELKDGIKQIENFGEGYCYIECMRIKVNSSDIEAKAKIILKDHPAVKGLLLLYLTPPKDTTLNFGFRYKYIQA